MARQLSLSDLIPAEMVAECRRFIDGEYFKRRTEFMLPSIRTKEEAYGHLTQNIVQMSGAAKAVSSELTMAMNALLTSGNAAFTDAAQGIYTSALDTMVFAISVAVCAMNVTTALVRETNNPTPIEKAVDQIASVGSVDHVPDAQPDTGEEYLPEGFSAPSNDTAENVNAGGENAENSPDSANDSASGNVTPITGRRGRRAAYDA